MLGEGDIEAGAGDQGCAHDVVVEDGLAVVGESNRSRCVEGGHVGELLAERAKGDGGHGEDADGGVAFRGEDVLHGGNAIGDGGGVGHGDDGGDAAEGRGARAGADGLFPGLAGLAEVDVEVDEAGEDVEAGGVDVLGRGGVGDGVWGFDGGDAAIADEEVAEGVDAGGWVY